MTKVALGKIHADAVTQQQALEHVERLVRLRVGGYVVTPNVDHVVMAESNEELRACYQQAALSLIDGMPLVWLARAAGTPVPAKLSGSDFIRPLMERAARHGWRVYFLGGKPGVGERAANRLTAEVSGLRVVGIDAPPLGFERDESTQTQVLERVRAARPHIVLMALGCPKQELLMHEWRHKLAPAVAFGIGAGLDFIAGERRRAPAWLSRMGLEWFYRLLQEPRRMAKRYLLRDPLILPIACRTIWHARRAPRPPRALAG